MILDIYSGWCMFDQKWCRVVRLSLLLWENPTRYTHFIIMRYSGLVMWLPFLILIYLIMHIA